MKQLISSLRKMGIAYLVVWSMVLLSGAVSLWFFRSFNPEVDLIEQGKTLLVTKSIMFFVSLAIMIYGVVVSARFSSYLRSEGISGGRFILLSMLLMLLALLISLQSIPGINVNFSLIACSEAREFFATSSIHGIISLVAMMVFMASVILTYIGINKISKGKKDVYAAIKGIKNIRISTLIVMGVSICFSPILLAYFDANTLKYEDVTLLNSIAGICYITSVAYFISSWFNTRECLILPASEITQPEYDQLNPEDQCLLASIGKIYAAVWSTILISLAILTGYYLEQSKILALLSLIPYIAVWFFIILGILLTGCNNPLSHRIGNRGMQFLRFSFICLGLICILSLNSPFGGNVRLAGYLDWESISDIFSEMPDSFDSSVMFTGVSAMFLFVLFPILSLAGTIFLSKAIPRLKKAVVGAIFLTLSSLLFAPLLICMAAEEYIDGLFTYFTVASVFYTVGIYVFSSPWHKCDRIVKSPDGISVTEESKNKLRFPLGAKEILTLVRTDRYLLTVSICSVFSILLALVLVLFNLKTYQGHSTVSPLTSNRTTDNSEKTEEAVEVIGDNLEDEMEVYEIETTDFPMEIESMEETMVSDNKNEEIIRKLYSIVLADIDDNPTEEEILQFERRHLSKEMISRLKASNDYDTDYVSYEEFRTCAQDGDGDSKLIDITPLKEGWYVVTYLDMGNFGKTEVKIEKGQITDYRKFR